MRGHLAAFAGRQVLRPLIRRDVLHYVIEAAIHRSITSGIFGAVDGIVCEPDQDIGILCFFRDRGNANTQ